MLDNYNNSQLVVIIREWEHSLVMKMEEKYNIMDDLDYRLSNTLEYDILHSAFTTERGYVTHND